MKAKAKAHYSECVKEIKNPNTIREYHTPCENCPRCGEFISCSLFYTVCPLTKKLLNNGINRNKFFVSNKNKKLQCQCPDETRNQKDDFYYYFEVKNKYADFCYNCKAYDCTDCSYDTDHEDSQSQYSGYESVEWESDSEYGGDDDFNHDDLILDMRYA